MRTSALLALAALAACESKPAAPPAAPPAPAPAPAPASAAAPAPAAGVPAAPVAPPSAGPAVKDLGGGYKDAKWGMTPEQVEALLGAPTTKDTDKSLPDRLAYEVFALKDDGQATKRELVAYFLDGKFFRALLLPNFSP